MNLNLVPSEKTLKPWMQAQILWALLIVGAWAVFLFFSPLDRDYTSGELLDHVLAWNETGTLYQTLEKPPYRVLNYPPLFLWGVREMSSWGLSPLQAGRLLNGIGFLCAVWLLTRWLKKERLSPLQAGFIASLLATSFPVVYAVGQFRLEIWGFTLTLFGLSFLRIPDKGSKIFIGGVLLGLACFAKQTQAVSILIAAAWLAFYHRRLLPSFLAGAFVTGAFGCVWIFHAFGPEAFRHLIHYTVGTYSFAHLIKNLIEHFLPWVILTALALGWGMQNPGERKKLTWWYWAGSTLWLLSSARRGASSQYFIEWCFAALLWIGPLLKSGWEGTVKAPFGKKATAFLLIFQIVGADLGVAGVLAYNLKLLKETNDRLPEICSHLSSGPVLIPSEEPGIVRSCGRIPALHPFIMASLSRQDLWEETPFVKQLSEGAYPLVLLTFDPRLPLTGLHAEVFTPSMVQAIKENYNIFESIGDFRVLKYAPRNKN